MSGITSEANRPQSVSEITEWILAGQKENHQPPMVNNEWILYLQYTKGSKPTGKVTREQNELKEQGGTRKEEEPKYI